MAHLDGRVTPLTLDVTSVSQIQRAVDDVDTLDVLINIAGVAIYDELSNLDLIKKHQAVNFLGLLKVTNARTVHACAPVLLVTVRYIQGSIC